MVRASTVRTREDLERTVRALSYYFKTDAVVVIGSQSVLVGWADAPVLMRTSGEIDAYPANARLLQDGRPDYEVSEEIFAMFGEGSHFAETHGFYVDGVDETTAKLPHGWQHRAVYHETVDHIDGRRLRAIAPCTDDMIVSKLHRLVEKDVAYIRACHSVRPLDINLLKSRLLGIEPPDEIRRRAGEFLDTLPILTSSPVSVPTHDTPTPPYPTGTHEVFRDYDGAVYVREWDETIKLFNRVGNTLGPAIVRVTEVIYAIDGFTMNEEDWRRHPQVEAATSADRECTSTSRTPAP